MVRRPAIPVGCQFVFYRCLDVIFLAVEYGEVNVTSLDYSTSLVPKEVTCINN